MQANTLEYRLERIEEDISAILENGHQEPKIARNFVVSGIAISISILGSFLAFGDWAIRTRIAPIETKVEYQYAAIMRIENKVDRLIQAEK